MIIHTVKRGESIYSIAQTYGVSPGLILEINGLSEDETLVVGQSILVLIPEVIHRAAEGETLYRIAVSYGKTVKELLRNNPALIGYPYVRENDEIIISYQTEKAGIVETNGYAYPYVKDSILIQSLPYMTYLSPFTYGITETGGLVPLDDGKLISFAEDYSVMPLMHLSTLTEQGGFSNELASLVLNSPEIRENLIAEIKKTISEKGYGGIDIDFEFVFAEDAELYADFINQLRIELAPKGLKVFSALAPKTSDEQKGSLYEGHNYELIGAASDAVLLMTYEWGYTYGPPMAVAPIGPVRRVLEYALTHIPPEKIFLGIPNYGYDWTLPFVKGESRAHSISNPEAVGLARRYGREILFDSVSMTPHFNYTDEAGREHEVWFEDVRSMRAKYELVSEFSLKGMGYWNLMRPFASNWSLLNAMFDIYGY